MIVQPDMIAVFNDVAGAGGHTLDVNAQAIIAVDIAVIEAVDLILHQRLEGFAGIIDHELLDHGRGAYIPVASAIAAITALALAVTVITGCNGGIGVHIAISRNAVVSIAVLGNNPLILHQCAQGIVDVLADLTVGVCAGDQLVRLIIDIRTNRRDLLVLTVGLLNQIPAFIIGVGDSVFPAVTAAAGDLIELIELVVYLSLHHIFDLLVNQSFALSSYMSYSLKFLTKTRFCFFTSKLGPSNKIFKALPIESEKRSISF